VAQDDTGAPDPKAGTAASAPPQQERPAAIGDRDTLGGDLGGVRPALDTAGIKLGVAYKSEVLDNPVGGVGQGAVYQGVLVLDLDVDAGKAAGLDGLTLHSTAYQIHGRGLSASYVGNLLTVSSLEARSATRLSTLYAEQAIAGDLASLRIGQLAADTEFVISDYAASLVNGTFGWPDILAFDLPSGGPAYPLGTPGVRGKIGGGDGFSAMAAVFNGDPVGPGTGDPQRRDPSGTAFRIGDNALAIVELAYGASEESRQSGLAGKYKLGGWYHSGRFADERFDVAGLSLADPASSGQPAQRQGNYGLYAVVDQMVWRHPTEHGEWLGAFLRVAGSPDDRNLISFYADAGLTANGLVPGRGDDIVTLGVAVARISSDARRLDRDARTFTGTDLPLRDAEALVELTYQAHFAPWLIVQPDLQYIAHPGGHKALPGSATPIPDAVVAGLRTTIRF
jgi:porin